MFAHSLALGAFLILGVGVLMKRFELGGGFVKWVCGLHCLFLAVHLAP